MHSHEAIVKPGHPNQIGEFGNSQFQPSAVVLRKYGASNHYATQFPSSPYTAEILQCDRLSRSLATDCAGGAF